MLDISESWFLVNDNFQCLRGRTEDLPVFIKTIFKLVGARQEGKAVLVKCQIFYMKQQ